MARTVGIEEELLVVDSESGRPLSVSERVLRRAAAPDQRAKAGLGERDDDSPGGAVEAELQQQQVETDTPPRTDLDELEQDVHAWRGLAATSARKSGARIVASGTSPVEATPDLVRDSRYERMLERFGLTTTEHLTCGCHVHVAVDSDDEGVGVLDRIRVWLPALLAVSANSPYFQGKDTYYASFRSQLMVRWPSAGPYDVYGSAEAYHRLVDDMCASGVLLDKAMAYFDARLSARYPTVEIRVADVCMEPGDAVLLAALCRGLVETAARDWSEGGQAPAVPTAMLRLATWQAGREGVKGELLDPATHRPRPATEVINALVDHVRPALEDAGDAAMVEERVDTLLERGSGADRQRSVLERTGRLADVVADTARVTAGVADPWRPTDVQAGVSSSPGSGSSSMVAHPPR
jgi:carboxylate-amine ligase